MQDGGAARGRDEGEAGSAIQILDLEDAWEVAGEMPDEQAELDREGGKVGEGGGWVSGGWR